MDRFPPRTRVSSLATIGLVAFATIAGAWIFQANGVIPCELCLAQRYAYYLGVPLAAVLAALAALRGGTHVTLGIAILALIFFGNAVLGIYHSGVEAKLWAGPDACTGSISGAIKASDLLNQLQSIKVVRCDEVQWRLAGLTLANFNVLISALLAGLAARALRQP